MKITYDTRIDAAYIQLAADIGAGGVAKTVPLVRAEVGGEINLDFDRNGRLIGIEVFGRRTHVGA